MSTPAGTAEPKAPDVEITVDHVVPVALGGSDEPSNLAAACDACNGGKTLLKPRRAARGRCQRGCAPLVPRNDGGR